MNQNFFGTVLQVIDDNHYVVQTPMGLRFEAVTYRSGLTIEQGTRVFVEFARESGVWLIADAST